MDTFITRKLKSNKIYNYYEYNKIIKDKILLAKIANVYIPPAYTDVKIYLNKRLLATGVDSAGRTQYIYSDYSKKKREEKKRSQLMKLSTNINRLKKKIKNDLLETDFTKNKLVALVLKIMDLCNFRGGNKDYEKKYGSYGLTTLHKKHLKIKKKSIEFDFIGKKGVNNHCIIENKEIQKIVEKVYKLSSKEDPYLFSIKYNGEIIDVSILDLNKYLEQFDVTCKDLRTWNANMIFLKNVKKELNSLDENYFLENNEKKLKIKKKLIREAIKNTATSLHHSPTICKSSYIFKEIIEQIESNEKNDKIIISLKENNINLEDFLNISVRKR